MKVHGSVLNDQGKTTNATVELLNPTGDIIDQVQVDDHGRFTYHLAPGRWTLNIYDAQGHRARREVELVDRDVEVDIELS